MPILILFLLTLKYSIKLMFKATLSFIKILFSTTIKITRTCILDNKCRHVYNRKVEKSLLTKGNKWLNKKPMLLTVPIRSKF